MGSRVFDYLQESLLFRDDLIQSRYGELDDASLEREVRSYRDFVDSVLDELASEIHTADGQFKVLAGEGKVDARLLSQCAWYVNQFVVDDLLYELGRPKSIAQGPMEHLLGLKTKKEFDRDDLVRSAKLLKSLTPMVAADYVKLLPISRLFEPPKELPITFSPNGFADALPKPLMEWFRGKAHLLEVAVESSQMIARASKGRELTPRRAIGIEFGEPGEGHLFVYHLVKTEVVEMDEKTGIVHFINTLPDEPPGESEFRAWVNQSKNQAARTLHHRIMTEGILAGRLGATYLTQSPLVAELLALEPGTDQDISVHTANAVLSLDVPFVEGADVATVMQIRQDDGEAFQTFREALEQKLREVQLEQDPGKARTRARHAVHELATVQVAAINRKVRAMQTRGLIEGGIAIAGLVGAVTSGAASLLATAGAVLAGAKTLADYRMTIRENPAYFLWKVSRATKQT